jgi:hypothetical protein
MTAAGCYAAEMRRVDEDIVKTEAAASSDPADPERITRHVYRLYQKASISGDLAGLTAGRTCHRRRNNGIVEPGRPLLVEGSCRI